MSLYRRNNQRKRSPHELQDHNRLNKMKGGLQLFQKFFLLCRRQAFQLGNLVVAFVLQRGSQAPEKLGPSDSALNIRSVLQK